MPKIKIFVTYKEKHRILKSDILTPIQAGRAIANEVIPDTIGDDTGENISNQNDIYSELSSIYWVWKNYEKVDNPDYVGFMQYRRQFLFDVKNIELKHRWIGSFYKFKYLRRNLLNSFSDKNIRKVVTNYDYLIPDWHDVRDVNVKTVKAEYLTYTDGANEEIFDCFIDICKRKIPEYIEEIQNIENGNKVLACNMFIFKKELFFKYCEFAFSILFELVDKTNQRGLNISSQRFAGYMAEKLLSMFVMKLEKENEYKGKTLYCTYIVLPDEIKWKKFLRYVFSVRNINDCPTLTVLGIKIKLKKENKNSNGK